MTLLRPTRRAALAGAFAAGALAALPAAAQDEATAEAPPLEERGYALGDMAIGDPDAPVTVIEYASLTCPHCATFHQETLPEVRERYVETGRVRFVFREVYFDQYGLWTSMIARCGGEDAFFPLIDAFLDKQRAWTGGEQGENVDEIMRIGRLGGLSTERMQECLTDEAFLTRLVEDYKANAEADGVRSTPSFLIDGEMHSGAMGIDEFSSLLDDALGS